MNGHDGRDVEALLSERLSHPIHMDCCSAVRPRNPRSYARCWVLAADKDSRRVVVMDLHGSGLEDTVSLSLGNFLLMYKFT